MVQIKNEACAGCGRCVEDCIAQNLRLRGGKAEVAGACFLCGHCVAICPENAVSIPEYDMTDVEGAPAGSLDGVQLLKTIKFRRSVRSYRQTAVPQEELALLSQAGRYTATTKNMQGCRFLYIQRELAELKRLVWDGLGRLLVEGGDTPAEVYRDFYEAYRANPQRDRLFLNAPAVLFVASQVGLDAGLAVQSMELLGVSRGLGFLYNGYLRRAVEMVPEALAWLELGGKPLRACALLGYPAVAYERTAPRRPADVVYR